MRIENIYQLPIKNYRYPFLHHSSIVVGLTALVGLYLISRQNFLLFHTLAEMFSILVAWGIFVIAWNARNKIDNPYLLFIGIAYPFIGFIDLFHTISYKGMGVLQKHEANLPTQLWIAARYLESLTLFTAVLSFYKQIKANILLIGFFIITSLLLLSIFYWEIFPDCFLDSTGLTNFKKNSEYIISIILIATMVILVRIRNEFDPWIFQMLITSIFLTICAELAFTFYISVYGISNLVGHFFKLLSFMIIYKTVLAKGIKHPYDVLFRKLKNSEKRLKIEKDQLEAALNKINVLNGLLPICSYCKKIRDEQNIWHQMEAYIRNRSEADFSHSICPDCEHEIQAKYI